MVNVLNKLEDDDGIHINKLCSFRFSESVYLELRSSEHGIEVKDIASLYLCASADDLFQIDDVSKALEVFDGESVLFLTQWLSVLSSVSIDLETTMIASCNT